MNSVLTTATATTETVLNFKLLFFAHSNCNYKLIYKSFGVNGYERKDKSWKFFRAKEPSRGVYLLKKFPNRLMG